MIEPAKQLKARPVDTQDADLLAQVAAGNLQSLGQLFDRHQDTLRGYVCRLGVTPGDADDIVQSVFLEVVRSATRFDDRYAAKSWLLGIATMLVRRHRRSFVRQAARLVRLATEPTSQQQRSPEECYRSELAEQRFANAYSRLSAKKKEVFALVVLEGISGEEAAHSLGIPVGTVWTRLHHARRELRAALGEEAS